MDANRNPKGTWWDQHVGTEPSRAIAYFSAEFGLSECLPIYSGGLGVLSGDHVKSASGLGIPLVATVEGSFVSAFNQRPVGADSSVRSVSGAVDTTM